MKTIGIIGGMSYESSIHYYERINNQINELAGGLTCARMIIYNVNFEEIRVLMLNNEWDKIGEELARIAKILEEAGADYIAIATNTMHKLADYVQSKINIPLIHIADCVADKCKKSGADYAGSDDIIEKIKGGWTDFDLIVTVPSMMGKVGQLGKILGPKGLMPNPKTGGITNDLEKTLKEIKKGRIELKNDSYGILHNCIGKKSFDNDKIIENFNFYITSVNKLRPSTVKGIFIKKVSISTTMGRGVFVNL